MGARPEAGDRSSTRTGPAALTERDNRILAFERQWQGRAAAKEEIIRSEFGLSAARYYQLLNAVIDSPQAIEHDPMLVMRLQRLRDARAAARLAGSTLAEPGRRVAGR